MKIIKQMNSRERAMVIGGGSLALVILFWAWIIDPSIKGRMELATRIESKKQEILELRQLSRKISVANHRFGAIKRRMSQPGGPSLLSVIENISSSSGIKESVVSMEPQPSEKLKGFNESSVALKIEKITLRQLVELLKEAAKNETYIRMKRISIKPLYEDPDYLDVALTVSWYEES
ncbi:MAG: type II secretion system protein M [Nitrospinota bacterium]|nr:type II secretion system protein M [Nitrospinota bacterium]MDH5757498.1 type II secretion system protein M [Nitrospinota bacterium]